MAVLAVLVFLIVAVVALLVPSLVVYLAWNFAVPTVWHAAPHINFWPMWGMVTALGVIAGLFKTFTSAGTPPRD